MAVEDRPSLSRASSTRWPDRLVVRARIVWVASSNLAVRLPPAKVVIDSKCVVLPTTVLWLSRQIGQTPWGPHRGKEGEPCEWRHQPFYSKAKGSACIAKFATFYTSEVWADYRGFFATPGHAAVSKIVINSAKVLGIDAGASKEEVIAAFRATVRKVHPDAGGDTDAFQKLVEARNVLLAHNM